MVTERSKELDESLSVAVGAAASEKKEEKNTLSSFYAVFWCLNVCKRQLLCRPYCKAEASVGRSFAVGGEESVRRR